MYSVYSYNTDDLKRMPPRREESNKGDYGRLLCICGSVGMCGAAYLSAKAAYRTGTGLVKILTPKENLIPLQTSLPEAIITVYDSEKPDLNTVEAALEWADAVVIGCGLGRTQESRAMVSYVIKNCNKPTVVDADALNIISSHPVLKKYLKDKIITPHTLEMSRLTEMSPSEITENAEKVAMRFSEKYGAVCVLKRHRTVVAAGDGEIYINQSGNSGMATAGSGDVLAGIIGGILAQNKENGLSTKNAAALGVYIHGLAGDAAAETLGEYSLMAGDIIDYLPSVLKKI